MTKTNASKGEMAPESIAFAELVSYVEEFRYNDNDVPHVFKLSDLSKLYKACLEQLVTSTSFNVYAHVTCLKEKLIAQIPDLAAHSISYEVLLSYKRCFSTR